MDTIFALSSGRLPSGVAIVRVSGPDCRFVFETILGKKNPTPPRRATLSPVRTREGLLLDTALVLWFPGPESFTGEDCLELHLHGGVAVVKSVLRELERFNGFRQAEAGEFTRRAFVNGKFDLIEAEALSDLISAETEAQRRFAIQSSEGRQKELYANWRQRILFARAEVEALLDFSDERDVPDSPDEFLWRDLKALIDDIEDHCRAYQRAEIIRDGFDVVIAGRPNAGKSSLLNALARRDVAIVSPEAGTTRDLIEVNLDLDGYKVRLTDTAGLRETEQEVERIGVRRARERLAEADLVLSLVDMTAPDSGEYYITKGKTRRIGTKADLASDEELLNVDLKISVVTGQGIGELLQMVSALVAEAAAPAVDVVPSQLRHVSLITAAQRHLENALKAEGLELKAEALRLASREIGRISGDVDVEDILDSIFSRFCIGK